jgi:ketosteroid isomerase-like protein
MPTSPPPHPNEALLTRLFTALGKKDHAAMASCYHVDAVFRDIAFSLQGREKIHEMWRLICHGDIRVTFVVVEADDHKGRVKLIDSYTFHSLEDPSGPGNPVVNAIESRFEFEGGEILRQDDYCDAKDWARQALGGGIKSFLAGRIRLLRIPTAKAKLARFLDEEESQPG